MEPLPTKPRPPFLAPVGVTNVALGKLVTASVETLVRGTLAMVTDGKKEAFKSYLVELPEGLQWVQVDLGRAYSIYAIAVWHDADSHLPVFRCVIFQVADDAHFTSNVRTLFNNDYENLAGLGRGTDKQYFETHEGKLVDAKGTEARYVRCYSKGSNVGSLNGYAEIEVWALELK